jgi:hypothetical protein
LFGDLTEYTLRIIEQGINEVRNRSEYLCCGCSFVKRVNWKYAITTFVVLRYAITIREIGYMPLQFNQMPKLNGKFPILLRVAMASFQYHSELQWQVSACG